MTIENNILKTAWNKVIKEHYNPDALSIGGKAWLEAQKKWNKTMLNAQKHKEYNELLPVQGPKIARLICLEVALNWAKITY